MSKLHIKNKISQNATSPMGDICHDGVKAKRKHCSIKWTNQFKKQGQVAFPLGSVLKCHALLSILPWLQEKQASLIFYLQTEVLTHSSKSRCPTNELLDWDNQIHTGLLKINYVGVTFMIQNISVALLISYLNELTSIKINFYKNSKTENGKSVLFSVNRR